MQYDDKFDSVVVRKALHALLAQVLSKYYFYKNKYENNDHHRFANFAFEHITFVWYLYKYKVKGTRICSTELFSSRHIRTYVFLRNVYVTRCPTYKALKNKYMNKDSFLHFLMYTLNEHRKSTCQAEITIASRHAYITWYQCHRYIQYFQYRQYAT